MQKDTNPNPGFSQKAAGNKPPKGGQGNSQSHDETNEKTRQSDGKRATGDVRERNGPAQL